MLKRSFWLAVIVAPLCFSPACELVSDAVINGGLKGGHDNGAGGTYGMDDGSGGMGAYDGHRPMCKPLDEEATKCPNPHWEDSDKDGCIDQYYCDDQMGHVNPIECKPVPEDLFLKCKNPVTEDRDGDGCIDLITCLDHMGEPVGGPDDVEPTMCKPVPDTEGCTSPHFEDRDGDGCIDLYVCLDYAVPQEHLPPPPAK